MKSKTKLFLTILLFCSFGAMAQVPVSQEPSHHPVFQNQYIRLLDVTLNPGDTTQFHIHATPSLFLHLSNTNVSSQIMGKEWVKDRNETGKAWYKSFSPEILVHRVTNCDTVLFHVTDLEILSSFDTTTVSPYKHLPFDLLFENEKAVAYGITNKNIMQKVAKNRGPLLAELATGDEVFFHNAETRQSKEIKTGHYLYIDPGTPFYFTGSDKSEIKMVLFEIK
ncbi:MAG: hypothetical protein IPP15_01435 [Saprospiraceae bacterium]|uniref:Uncharacterized protein n=1 Tax=Candidatus Opimibacter skivensis TaxID=2982028 RepID=A0A9D7XLG2_9BACT|nr:hypothetical protein [Candidatus Opimibacter skivensis]